MSDEKLRDMLHTIVNFDLGDEWSRTRDLARAVLDVMDRMDALEQEIAALELLVKT